MVLSFLPPGAASQAGFPPPLLAILRGWAPHVSLGVLQSTPRSQGHAQGRAVSGEVMHLQRELAEPHQSHFKSQATAGLPHEATAATEPPPLRSRPAVASR